MIHIVNAQQRFYFNAKVFIQLTQNETSLYFYRTNCKRRNCASKIVTNVSKTTMKIPCYKKKLMPPIIVLIWRWLILSICWMPNNNNNNKRRPISTITPPPAAVAIVVMYRPHQPPAARTTTYRPKTWSNESNSYGPKFPN